MAPDLAHVHVTGIVPSFRTIFDTYAPFVWRVLRRLGVREAELADVSQETFLVLHRRLDTFEGRSSLKTFVYGVAVRVAADHRKKAWVRRERAMASDDLPEAAPGDSPTSVSAERALVAKQALLQLDKILAEMDEDRRVVFVLYELEELSLAEIVEVTGAPLSTVHARLTAARETVRTRLARASSLPASTTTSSSSPSPPSPSPPSPSSPAPVSETTPRRLA